MVGVEQVAAVGGQLSRRADAAVDRPEGGEQTDTRHRSRRSRTSSPMLVGGFPKLCPKRGDGVVLIVQRIAQEQQSRSSAQKRNTSRIITVRAASYSSVSLTSASSFRRGPGRPGRATGSEPRRPCGPDSQAGR